MLWIFLISFSFAKQVADIKLDIAKGWNYFSFEEYTSSTDFSRENLQIQFVTSSNTQTKLAICSNLASTDVLDENTILKDCSLPFLQGKIQSITISQQSHSKIYEQIYSTYAYTKGTFSIALYSEKTETVGVIMRAEAFNSCISECLNGGQCRNGVCQCPMGFIGNECNQSIQNLYDYMLLQDDALYYLDFQNRDYIYLDKSQEFQLSCYYQNPNINAYPIYHSQKISLSQDQIDQCKLATRQIENEVSFTLYPYFVIRKPLKGGEQESELVFVIVGATIGGVFLMASICFIIYKLRQNYQNKINIVVKPKVNQDKLNQYMPCKTFESLQVQKSREAQECSICLEVIKQDELVRVTYCNHIYHDSCITDWLEVHENCPICRQNLDMTTIEKFGIFSNRNQSPQTRLIRI